MVKSPSQLHAHSMESQSPPPSADPKSEPGEDSIIIESSTPTLTKETLEVMSGIVHRLTDYRDERQVRRAGGNLDPVIQLGQRFDYKTSRSTRKLIPYVVVMRYRRSSSV